MSVTRFGFAVRRFLHSPSKVLLLCLAFASVSLVFDGSLWRLWGLHRDFERMGSDIIQIQREMNVLNKQLLQAKDPSFIERQARDRLDLVGENDLVFVFPDDLK